VIEQSFGATEREKRRLGRKPGIDVVGTGGAVGALLMGFAACAAAPPAFSVEPVAVAVVTRETSRSVYVGHRSTPPPGQYRFARVYEEGTVEARDLFAVNGPGPWLSYESHLEIGPDLAREIVETAQAVPPAAAATGDDREPCVLALASGPRITWNGCAYWGLAARVLASVPALGPPDVASSCAQPVCQVRLIEEAPARPHDSYGVITRDIVLDTSGSFWCATPAGGPSDQPNTLQVVHGRIRNAEASGVWNWLMGDIARPMTALHEPPAVPPGRRVQIRGAGNDWSSVPASRATAVTSRWTRIAPRFPSRCHW
jgi:hypothetical protein